MVPSAFITVFVIQQAAAVTARERWQAMRHIDNGVVISRWFTAAMVVVLVVSVIAFVVVSLYRKVRELKAAEEAFLEGAKQRGLTEGETDTLLAVAIEAGLRKGEAIFGMSNVFEQGAARLLEESFSAGQPTAETGRVRKHLSQLREKLGFPRPVGASSPVTVSQRGSSPGRGAESLGRGAALVALFPLVRRVGARSGGGASRPLLLNGLAPGTDLRLAAVPDCVPPEFVGATITTLAGQVVFLETTLGVNVGDRVLLVITIGDNGKDVQSGAYGCDFLEDVGVVQQSTQPAEPGKPDNLRRLAVGVTGLSEAQLGRLAGALGLAATSAAKTGGGSQEAETIPQPVGTKEG